MGVIKSILMIASLPGLFYAVAVVSMLIIGGSLSFLIFGDMSRANIDWFMDNSKIFAFQRWWVTLIPPILFYWVETKWPTRYPESNPQADDDVCEFCGRTIDAFRESCLNCGAPYGW